MSEFVKRLKELSKDKKIRIILPVFIVSLIFLFAGGTGEEKDEASSGYDTHKFSREYTENIEKELENILSKINGAGKVQVMVTLDNCFENVYATSYDTKTQEDDNKTQSENQEEYVIVKKGSNNEECLVVKVYEPQVKGVAVVAEGADSVYVKRAITETVCALFDISSAKVSVEKFG